MNQIICDVCGTPYPETEERCPVCSYPRQGNEKTADASADAAQAKVKGGRFSSKNVKKRQKAQRKAQKQGDLNKPLIIVIALLLLAIVLVALYIGARFFRGRDAYRPALQTTAPAASTEQTEVLCSQIVLGSAVLDLEQAGEQKQLDLQLLPADTTEQVSFVSADPNVAEVSETGLITAVGSGQTTVTVTCGSVSQVCTIVCWFQEETTLPAASEPTQVPVETEPKQTEPKPTQPKQTEPKATEPKADELTLDLTDVSCFTRNEVFDLYVRLGGSSVGRSKVTWTSSDPSVATVEKGTVTAVGPGTATITAEYEGKKARCVVRCRFEDDTWKASASDVTIAVGDSFRLTVTNGSGETADAIWTMSVDGVVSIDGKTITGRAPGTVTLKTTVDDVTLTCIVRVK